MEPINQPTNQVNVDGRYRILLILWFAILMAVGILFFIVMLIPRPPADQSGDLFFWLLAALAVSLLIASFVVKSKMLAQSVRDQRQEMVQSALIIALALCEVVGLFGMLAYFITTSPYYYIFFILGAIGILLHMPRRDQLLAASYKKQD